MSAAVPNRGVEEGMRQAGGARVNSGRTLNFIDPTSRTDGVVLTTRCGGRMDSAPSINLEAFFTSKIVEPATVVVDACHLWWCEDGNGGNA